jgi:hypothetical protein
MELKELIRQYPELGEVFAELENRISYLENSLTYHQEEPKLEIQPVFKPRPVDKEIDQLKAGYLHLENKINEHLIKSKNRDRI